MQNSYIEFEKQLKDQGKEYEIMSEMDYFQFLREFRKTGLATTS